MPKHLVKFVIKIIYVSYTVWICLKSNLDWCLRNYSIYFWFLFHINNYENFEFRKESARLTSSYAFFAQKLTKPFTHYLYTESKQTDLRNDAGFCPDPPTTALHIDLDSIPQKTLSFKSHVPDSLSRQSIQLKL